MESQELLRQQKPLLGKFRLAGTLVIATGLHIGGGGESLDIGGLDKPVLRNPMTREPYIPGSSIKGKLRAILERLFNKPLNRSGGSGTFRYESDDLLDGLTDIGQGRTIPFEGARTCPVSRLFGSTGSNCYVVESAAQAEGLLDNNNTRSITHSGRTYRQIRGRNHPSRLMVRDCSLLPESAAILKEIDSGLYMTEWKFENGLDRITAAANPRQIERVPAGAEFSFEFTYTVENSEQASEDLNNLAIALAILEDDALGGHGSRGYGKVRFQNLNLFYRDVQQYRRASAGEGQQQLLALRTFINTDNLLDAIRQTVQPLLPEA